MTKYQTKELFNAFQAKIHLKICAIAILCIPNNSQYEEERKHSLLSKLDESEVGHKFGSFCTLGKVLRGKQ